MHDSLNGAVPRPALTELDLVLRSSLFDCTWYVRTYPDVEMTRINPAEHFLRYGGLLERAAGPNFSRELYPEAYAQAAATRANPLVVHIHSQETAR